MTRPSVGASGDHVQQAGGVATGGEQGGALCVQVKVSDGFGGELLKRSYWRKRMVPDGLVQRRIDRFSTRVPKLGEGWGSFWSVLVWLEERESL
jgi:hypothetical protein